MPITKNITRIVKKARSVGLPNINWKDLIKCCRTRISAFEKDGFIKYQTNDGVKFFFKDNDSDILAVANLDTKMPPLHTTPAKLHKDTKFFSPVLAGRAGVYAILNYLPQLMQNNVYDILLTTGSKRLQSSARYFKPRIGKKYKWVFSFDNEGKDASLYQYYDDPTAVNLMKVGWRIIPGTGYSDIVDLEHLRCKGINFGIGIYNTQDPEEMWLSRNAFLECMLKFMRFWRMNCKVILPHTPLFNIYIISKGFTYYEDRVNERCFTDEEMDTIESLENMGYDFETWATIIVPEDVKDLVLEYQRLISNEGYLREMEKVRKSQFNLFDSKKFQKVYNEAKIILGSEDNLEYKQSRKIGNEAKTSNDVAIIVTHKPALQAKDIDNGISVPILSECIRCGKPYEFSSDAKQLVCPDCGDEHVELEVLETGPIRVKLGPKLVMYQRSKGEKIYEFDETKTNWFETGREFTIPTSSKRKPKLFADQATI